MERRKVVSLSLAFLLGMAAVEYRKTALWWMLGCYSLAWAVTVCSVYRQSIKKGIVWILAFLLAVFGGCYNSYSRQVCRNAYESEWNEGGQCQAQGQIYQKENENGTYLYYLKHCSIQLHHKNYSCNQILVNLNGQEHFIGEILCIKGTIKPFSTPVNEGNYNEKAYYRSLNIDFKLEADKVIFAGGKKNAIKEQFVHIKEQWKESYQKAMPEADAGVLAAMTLGDKSLMDYERKKMYQDAGISHFYSISGLHISMLGMAFYQLLRKRGMSYAGAGIFAALMILSYGELIGFGISASRAIGMFLLLIYAKYRGRAYDRATALSLMAAVLAGENPGLLHHAGFLLSFGAVAGVMLAGEAAGGTNESQKNDKHKFAKDRWKIGRKLKKAVKGLRETLLVSICIQMMTIPVMCQFFYEISVCTVFVNLIVLPCMGVLLGMGIAGGIMGCFFPLAGKVLLYPCYLILLLFDRTCQFCLNLPHASVITGALSFTEILLWYGGIAVVLLLRAYGKKISALLLALPLGMLLLLPQTPEFELDFLDVGQGDGIFLATGDGTAMFIDGGSSNVSKVGTYRILPFLKYRGIQSIDYWFISHCDADHISGFLEIAEAGYRIKHLVVSAYLPYDSAWQEVEELAGQKGIPILKMNSQDSIKGRDWSIQSFSLEQESPVLDRNKASLVLLFEQDGFRGFFAGDIGEEEERELAQAWEFGKIDVYKASHHGSEYSNSSVILNAIAPRITVISCSMHNRYGHPGRGTMERLRETDSSIYETRYLGQIKIDRMYLEGRVWSVFKYEYEENR